MVVERLGDLIKSGQARKNKLSDQRSIMLNECLQGVRTVKLCDAAASPPPPARSAALRRAPAPALSRPRHVLTAPCAPGRRVRCRLSYAWEGVVERRVSAKRDEELGEIRRIALLRAVQNFLSFGVPTIVTVPVFYLYKRVNGELPTSIIFTAVSIFEFLNMALIVLPNLLNEVRRMYVSIGRIAKFLDIANTYQQPDAMVGDTGGVVLVGDFSWGSARPGASTRGGGAAAGGKPKAAPGGGGGATTTRRQPQPAANAPAAGEAALPGAAPAGAPVLTNMQFRADGGKLVVVCGRVGSGKTSLASAVLGLLQPGEDSGATVTGRTAYVPQQSFVMNDTVRNNILFGAEYDEAAYNRVLLACSLDKDLAALPSGDETEIGERGITISGGQRQRIAVARAAYANVDLIVLDDPLSAMDPHVGRQVMDNCVLGLLGGKTRVFCTNQLQFAAAADEIYYLDGGRIVERGSFAELSRKEGGAFAALYAHVSSTPQMAEDAEEERANRAGADAAARAAAGGGDKPAAPPAGAAAPPAAGGAQAAPKGAEQRRAEGKLVLTEKRALGRVGLSTFIPLARAANARLLGGAVALFIALMPFSQYTVNILLSRWADAEAGGDEDAARTWVPLYIGAAVLFGLIVFLRGISCAVFFTRASDALHASMLRAVLAQPMRFFDTTPVGRVLNRFSGDMLQLDVMMPRLFDIWAFIIGSNLTTVLLSMVFAPPMIVINFVLGLGFLRLYNYYAAVAVELQRIIMVSISPLVASFSSFLIGLESIRAFNRVETFRLQFQARQLAFARAFTALVAIERFTMTFAVTVGVSVFLAALSLALLFLARARFFVTPGSAGVTLAYAAIISFRLPAMFLMSVTLERLLSAAQRVIEYVDLPPEENAEWPLALKRGGSAGSHAGRGARELGPVGAKGGAAPAVPANWPARGTLVLRDVHLRYAEGAPEVLSGISFSVAHGERVGVVGRTGAGKSSVLLAIFRMAPTTGLIEIGGLDVSSPSSAVSRRLVRARLGMIPQDSVLFSGTIRSNLDVEDAYSDDELRAVLRLAHLDGMVDALADGLDAQVTEKGDNFSAGEGRAAPSARARLRVILHACSFLAAFRCWSRGCPPRPHPSLRAPPGPSPPQARCSCSAWRACCSRSRRSFSWTRRRPLSTSRPTRSCRRRFARRSPSAPSSRSRTGSPPSSTSTRSQCWTPARSRSSARRTSCCSSRAASLVRLSNRREQPAPPSCARAPPPRLPPRAKACTRASRQARGAERAGERFGPACRSLVTTHRLTDRTSSQGTLRSG